MKRRSFLKAVGGAVGAGALAAAPVKGEQPSPATGQAEKAGGLPRREVGRTGIKASIVGFPGLALIHQDQDPCTAAIHDAFQRGVNYYDVAPAYGHGDAEIKMGIGLQGIDRDKYYLACKTKKRDKEGAREELERSLERLKTTYFDVYQLHALMKPSDSEEALAPGGAIETLVKAREEGKVRHLGFSAHTMKAALKVMQGFRFDTVMFPINFIELLRYEFAKPVLELAAEQGAAVLAIKPMCRGAWPQGQERTRRWWYRPVEDDTEVSLAVRFTLSQSPVAVGFPPAFLDLLDKAIEAGKAFQPITEAETDKLRATAQTCDSIFHKREEQLARGGWQDDIRVAGCPHEWRDPDWV
jgi:predicted aldo/keto reductase-like oxidoreductase